MSLIPPLTERLDRLLPQTQCGQCGFDGCRPYAAAMARGEAGVERCPPGGDAGARALQADVLHCLVEARAVFGLVDGVGVGTDHLDAEFFQDAVLFQIQSAAPSTTAMLV